VPKKIDQLLSITTTRTTAFSLVEIVVVLAIVGTLIVLVLPALQYAKMAADRSKCISNLRQIGTAIHAYAAEHNNDLPPTTHVTGSNLEQAWIFRLKPYLDNVDEVRLSPADPNRGARRVGGGTSYLLNNIVFDSKFGPFGEPLPSLNNLLRLPRPSKTFFAGIVSESNTGDGAQTDHTHAEGWDNGWSSFIADIQPNIHRVGASNADRTNGTSNYLFADGSVRNIPATEMKARFDAGENFARPPEIL